MHDIKIFPFNSLFMKNPSHTNQNSQHTHRAREGERHRATEMVNFLLYFLLFCLDMTSTTTVSHNKIQKYSSSPVLLVEKNSPTKHLFPSFATKSAHILSSLHMYQT